jgi:REG-2-like HAD superfamily hydrolase
MIKLSPKIKHIALDAVGTTIEAQPPVVEVYHQSAQLHGSKLTLDELKLKFKIAFQKHWLARVNENSSVAAAEEEEFELWKNIVYDTLDDSTDKPACFVELHEYFSRGQAWKIYPDVAVFLDWCKTQGLTVTIASNFDQRLQRVIRELPEFQQVLCVVPSTETLSRKPELKFFRHIEEKLRANPEQILLIGDSWNEDILGATRAGWHAIFLDRLHQNLAAQTANQHQIPVSQEVPCIHSLDEIYL